MSNKGSGWSLLLNIHQSLRAEQSARAQQLAAAILAAQAQQSEQMAAERLERLGDIKRSLDQDAKQAVRQAEARDVIFTIRKAVESLPVPQGRNADKIFAKCSELARAAPRPSAFDQFTDKEYCNATIELIAEKADEARSAVEAHILAQYEKRIENLASPKKAGPPTTFFKYLALRGDFPGKAAFKNTAHKTQLRALLDKLETKGDAARQALTSKEIDTVLFLRSGPQRFTEQASALAKACATAQAYHHRLMELAQLMRKLRAATTLLSPGLIRSQRWVEDLNRWEEDVLAPHQNNLFQFECMVLVAKVGGQLSCEEERVLHKAGQSIGLHHATAKKVVAATTSVRVAQFTGDPDQAERIIACLFDVACADGYISKEEAAFIQKTARALGVARDRLMPLYEKGRIGFLKAQMPRLTEEHVNRATDLVRQTLKARQKRKLFVEPDIPSNKLANVGRWGVPSNERVIGLLDLTAFGSAKNALIWGTKGLYWRHRFSQESLTYCDLLRSDVQTVGFPANCVIRHGGTELRVIAVHPWSGKDLRDLFEALISRLQEGWYVARSLNIEGSFTVDRARKMVLDGAVDPDIDLVWRIGLPAWTSVRDVPELGWTGTA